MCERHPCSRSQDPAAWPRQWAPGGATGGARAAHVGRDVGHDEPQLPEGPGALYGAVAAGDLEVPGAPQAAGAACPSTF